MIDRIKLHFETIKNAHQIENSQNMPVTNNKTCVNSFNNKEEKTQSKNVQVNLKTQSKFNAQEFTCHKQKRVC